MSKISDIYIYIYPKFSAGFFQAGTWNVDSVTGEVVYALYWRRIDVACVQETGWKDASFRFSGGL